MKSDVQAVVISAIDEHGGSMRRFGRALGVSHVTVANWRDGRSQPAIEFLIRTAREHDDWRRNFALECLKQRLGEDAFEQLGLDVWITRGVGSGRGR